ncbi:hypothetical protein [Seonamhaeicola maritimus]|uniref:HEPN AbiU2-like domain-containing protein n=1 Tax=Seonamhaeicola maritimus TaxID=2591822 RepID=A0A5C7GNC1_9FLAO|nr:hypothetical protein [Seonamhaeicola maritimus]TXG39587.1 hypothetical protein FUA22_06890 [Seonamhaeicola maritimus]
MKNNLTKTQESILVLCTLQALLDEYLKCLTKEEKKPDSVLFSIISSQIIITSCSYLDEWEYFGKLIKEEQEPRIITLRKITKPVIDRINEWKDMRQFRNNMLAHNHRIKKENNSLAIFNTSRKLNCPYSFYDYKLLIGCIFITKNVLLRMFQNEYNRAIPSIKNIEDILPINEIKDEKTYRNEFDNLTQDVQTLIDALI